MIRAQRTLHRRLWLTLALILPLLLALALVQRARHARVIAQSAGGVP